MFYILYHVHKDINKGIDPGQLFLYREYSMVKVRHWRLLQLTYMINNVV